MIVERSEKDKKIRQQQTNIKEDSKIMRIT